MKKTTHLVILFSILSMGIFAQAKHEGLTKIKKDATFRKEIWDYNKSKSFKYKGKKPIVIDFNATWCTPCKAIHPHLVDLQKEYGDKITIYSIDVDSLAETTDAFKVTNIPALVFIKDGKTKYFMSTGKKSKEELKELIETKLLGAPTK